MRSKKKYTFPRLIKLCATIACGLFLALTSGRVLTQNEVKPAQSGSHVITGKLVDYYGPIVKSQVYLNSMKDEDCAKFFQKKLFDNWKDSKKDRERLAACVIDVGPVEPNAEGVYTFSGLRPGFYALVVSWNTNQKFKNASVGFRKGDFVITYYEGAKYNAVSTGQAFYFSGTENVTKDFDFTQGSITKESVLKQ